MKTIPLTKGYEAIVDDEDYKELSNYKWQYHYGYARRASYDDNGTFHSIFMHRVINKTPNNYETDHINRNRLDNRKENLRTTTKLENLQNKSIYSNNKSGYSVITYFSIKSKWRVRKQVNNKSIFVGYFDTLDEAIKAKKERIESYI